MPSSRLLRTGRLVTVVGASIIATLLVTQTWMVDAAPGDLDSTFVPVAPCRLFDFRPGPDNIGPKRTPLAAGDGAVHTQQVTGTNGNCVIPDDAIGVAMNVTIVNPTAASNLRVFPADTATPLASNLNWVAGQSPTPNKVDVKLSPGGQIKLFNFAGRVDVLADVVGYYSNASLRTLDSGSAQLVDVAVPVGTAELAIGTFDGVEFRVSCSTFGVTLFLRSPGAASGTRMKVSGTIFRGSTPSIIDTTTATLVGLGSTPSGDPALNVSLLVVDSSVNRTVQLEMSLYRADPCRVWGSITPVG
jgi:hypothetical protein